MKPFNDPKYDQTIACENGLHYAACIMWQNFALYAANTISEIGIDYYDPARLVISTYLKNTGRSEEANEVLAIGCNEPPPIIVFGLSDKSKLRKAMDGSE